MLDLTQFLFHTLRTCIGIEQLNGLLVTEGVVGTFQPLGGFLRCTKDLSCEAQNTIYARKPIRGSRGEANRRAPLSPNGALGNTQDACQNSAFDGESFRHLVKPREG